MSEIGLRVDVDTFRGTRDGVPRLLDTLSRHGIHASFFFTLGPDNMGRHLWRLVRPRFLLKMLRSKAASLYGWDIILRGTLWPGPNIGRHLAHVIRRAAEAGHEIGVHAWDHHLWQMKFDKLSQEDLHRQIQLANESLAGILGREPDCSACAGWRCDERVLLEKQSFKFRYNSDCRGQSLFEPYIGSTRCVPQVPVTMPTYDELIGHDGVTAENYNERLLDYLRPGKLNVLTIHAEVEGIACAQMFDEFVNLARDRGITFKTLGQIVDNAGAIPPGRVEQGTLQGREGTLCLQAEASNQGSAI